MDRRVVSAAILTLGVLCHAPAYAQRGPSVATPPRCTLSGRPQPPKDLPLYDNRAAGNPIARLTGPGLPVTLTDLPEASGVRTRASVGAGFEVRGFVEPEKLPLYTVRDVPVAAPHIALARGFDVQFRGYGARGVRIRRKLALPFDQDVVAWAECAALSLDPQTPGTWSVPGNARGYVSQAPTIALFSAPRAGAAPVYEFRAKATGPGILFWSEETLQGFVRVELHRDVVVRGWARAVDLWAMPPGELRDEQLPARRVQRTTRLRFAEAPRLARLSQEAPLRISATDTAAPVGRVKAGTTLYVLHTIAGWASVLPQELDMAPPEGKEFWIPARVAASATPVAED